MGQNTKGYETLSLKSDQESYALGEVINISGAVEKYHESESVQIILYSPENRIISLLKADVTPQRTFSTFIDSGDFTKTGQYHIKANYGRYSEIVEVKFMVDSGRFSNTPYVNANMTAAQVIPSWIQHTAKMWSMNQITDVDFVLGMKYLVSLGVIDIPLETQDMSYSTNEIRKNAAWWSEGKVSDTEFLSMLQFLIQEKKSSDSPKLFMTAKSYRFGQPVTVTLIDPDLNADGDVLDIYGVINEPNSPYIDTVGANGQPLLEIKIKDIRYKRCIVDGIEHGGLASTGFTLIETGPQTGIFEGVFKIPSKICSKDGTELISVAGGSISARYFDFRDSLGQNNIVETR